MIQPCTPEDFNDILEIINDAAIAYKGIIPADRWHEPYMPEEELRMQINDGVTFYCYRSDQDILGVMGIQDKKDVKLIRHAYVRTAGRNKGIGTKLLTYLTENAEVPILIGTWADAKWAIAFYEKNGFYLVPGEERIRLLKKYWTIPERQIETSVVLADKTLKTQ
jgi:GNAT superfamily N-acetyltransferase